MGHLEETKLGWVVETRVGGVDEVLRVDAVESLEQALVLGRWIPRFDAICEIQDARPEIGKSILAGADVTFDISPTADGKTWAPIASFTHAPGSSEPIVRYLEECDKRGRDECPHDIDLPDAWKEDIPEPWSKLATTSSEFDELCSSGEGSFYGVNVELWEPSELAPYIGVIVAPKCKPDDYLHAKALKACIMANAEKFLAAVGEIVSDGDEISLQVAACGYADGDWCLEDFADGRDVVSASECSVERE